MVTKFRVVVNGKAYEVEVEEIGETKTTQATPVVQSYTPPVQTAPAPSSAPSAAPTPAPAAPVTPPTPTAPAGGTSVPAPMPGKILKVSAQPGSAVKSGDLLLVLEAMKMENEILAPTSGTVKEVRVKAGDSVNTGDTLVVIA